MTTTPSASQTSGDEAGVIKHVTEALSPTPDDARPLVPVKVVNATVPPGITDFDSGFATGAVGAATVGVMEALSTLPVVSETT